MRHHSYYSGAVAYHAQQAATAAVEYGEHRTRHEVACIERETEEHRARLGTSCATPDWHDRMRRWEAWHSERMGACAGLLFHHLEQVYDASACRR